MPHPRTTIRQKVALLLLEAETAAGDRVYDSKTQAITTLPALRVWTREDDFTEWRAMTGRGMERQLELVVECIHSNATPATAAANLDALAREVEVVFDNNIDIDDNALSAVYASTSIEFTDEVDPPLALASLLYNVSYHDEI